MTNTNVRSQLSGTVFENITLSSNTDLPDWTVSFLSAYQHPLISYEDRVRFVQELSQANVEHDTGGPFGAAVFDLNSGDPVSIGVNRVMPLNNSSAHAEIVALELAQKRLQTHDLRESGAGNYQLVSSAQMCTMCLGAVCWAGINEVVFSVPKERVEAITGFDEGPSVGDVSQALSARGIRLVANVLQDAGESVLRAYVKKNGLIYNPKTQH